MSLLRSTGSDSFRWCGTKPRAGDLVELAEDLHVTHKGAPIYTEPCARKGSVLLVRDDGVSLLDPATGTTYAPVGFWLFKGHEATLRASNKFEGEILACEERRR